ncbi:MAG: TonB-dependent receptor, partial [Burkholderiaceae bacterium]
MSLDTGRRRGHCLSLRGWGGREGFSLKTTRTVLAVAMAAAFGCAHAQSIQTLDPVVVSAARYEQQLSEVIPSVSVIDRDTIEHSQAQDLASLLMSEPGFEIGRNGGSGSTTSIFLRGMSSVNSAVFIDGVRVQTDRLGAFNFADIPLDMIDRVEIVR